MIERVLERPRVLYKLRTFAEHGVIRRIPVTEIVLNVRNRKNKYVYFVKGFLFGKFYYDF